MGYSKHGAHAVARGEAEESTEPDSGRVLALSDGVFAIAATLLALDLRVGEGLSSTQFHRALRELGPSLLGFVIAYLVIGLLWLAHRRIFAAVRHVTPRIAEINVLLLGFVVLLPFPSSLIADYPDEPVAVMFYAATVAAISLLQLAVIGIATASDDVFARRSGARVFTPSAVTAGVFLGSIPVALLSPTWAMLMWLLLIPAQRLVPRTR